MRTHTSYHGFTAVLWLLFTGYCMLPAMAQDLEVQPAAKYAGDYGLRVTVNDLTPTYVEDQTPTAETSYRLRFHARLNQLSLGALDAFDLFVAYDENEIPQLRISVGEMGGNPHLVFHVRLDNDSFAETSPTAPLPVGWNAVELHWTAGAGNGFLDIWLNDTAIPGLMDLDNDLSLIDTIRWGAVDGLDPTTSGRFDLDDFHSQRQDYIGAICFSDTDFQNALIQWPINQSVAHLVVYLNHTCTP